MQSSKLRPRDEGTHFTSEWVGLAEMESIVLPPFSSCQGLPDLGRKGVPPSLQGMDHFLGGSLLPPGSGLEDPLPPFVFFRPCLDVILPEPTRSHNPGLDAPPTPFLHPHLTHAHQAGYESLFL